jgi:hypothetical protein
MAPTVERNPMKRAIFPALAMGAALVLCACVQPQSDKARRVADLAPIPDNTSGYRPIAMAGASGRESEIGVDFDKLGKDQDLQLALMYGIDATANLVPDESKPEIGLVYRGAGDSWDRPIEVRGQAEALSTIANAYRYIADRFPGSKIASSTLYAGPPPNFVSRIEFSSKEGEQALYFDLTDWAAAWHKEVPN